MSQGLKIGNDRGIYPLTNGCDNNVVVRKGLDESYGLHFEIEAFVYCRTIFKVIGKWSNSAERRLQIDVCALIKVNIKRDSWRIECNSGSDNVADELTKENLSQNSAMRKLVASNKVCKDGFGLPQRRRNKITCTWTTGRVWDGFRSFDFGSTIPVPQSMILMTISKVCSYRHAGNWEKF